MKLPDFKSIDWKMLMLEKGQYGLVGLGAVIGGSLLFYSLASGVTAPSPTENQELLSKENNRVKTAFAAAAPDKNNAGPDGDVPPPKVDLTFSQGKPIDALAYMAGEPLLVPEDPAEIKRKMPKILQPLESRVEFARVPLRSAAFNADLDQLMIIEGVGSTGTAGGPGMGGPGMGAPGMGGPPGAGGPAGRGGNQMLTQFAPRFSRLKDRYEDDPRKSLPMRFASVGDLMSGKLGNAKFAEQALPLRMAVIAATYPYQSQLKEFQRKLKLPNIQSVLAETSANIDPRTGQPYSSFRFLRVELQRRTQNPDGTFGEWANVELEDSFRKCVNFTLGRTEKEDDILGLISFPGLVMPKLLTFYSSSDPQVPALTNAPKPGGFAGTGGVTATGPKDTGLIGQPQLYPEPENSLAKLQKMIKDYKDRKDQLIASLVQTKPKFNTTGSFDIFSPGSNGAGAGTPTGSGPGDSEFGSGGGGAKPGRPGGGAPGMGSGPPGMGSGMPGGRPGGFPGAGAPGGFPGAPGGFPGAGAPGGFPGAPGGFPGAGAPGGFPGAPGGFPGAGAPGGFPGAPGGFAGAPGLINPQLTQADLFAAEYALVRVYDPTVLPGETYQYRMRVVMSNPNFGRQDVASTGYAKEKEIVAEEWYQVPGSFSAPSDLACYVTETKATDPNRVNLEVYKWATDLNKKDTRNLPLGDWIKSTISVGRGEMVGRTSRVEAIPFWRNDVDGYSLVPVESGRGPNSRKGIDVEFKPNLGEQGDFMVVDFEGPSYRYEKITIQNDAPVRSIVTDDQRVVEVILQGTDNRLTLRSSLNDSSDPERTKLESLISRHINAAKTAIQNAKLGGGRPGGPGGPGGGGRGDGGGN